MTRNEANELRIKNCNLPLLEGPLYDPDDEEEFTQYCQRHEAEIKQLFEE